MKVIAKGLMEQVKTIPIYTGTFKETLLQEINNYESKSNSDGRDS